MLKHVAEGEGGYLQHADGALATTSDDVSTEVAGSADGGRGAT